MLDRLTIERMEAASGGVPVLVALSGGGDSAALLLLLAEHFGATRLSAAIVDHALRDGSAEDARRALAFAQALGITAQVLTLSWLPDANRSQQAAREARYRVLCAGAREQGARVIALGHTADDQAETVFMRAAAGSTWRGLAGIAPMASAPIWPEGRGLSVARPLLGARRDDLRALLRERKLDWLDDPANTNTMYERVRIRARLQELAAAGFDPMRLASLAARLRPRVEALDAAAAALIARAASFEADRIVIERAKWTDAGDVRRRALSVLVAAAAGAHREPAADAIERLDNSVSESNFHGATLAGARLSVARGAIVIDRDRGALEGRADGARPLPPLALSADVETVWDGRLALTASAGGVSVHADPPAPRLVMANEHIAPVRVERRWLLAERATHALSVSRGHFEAPKKSNADTNEVKVPKP